MAGALTLVRDAKIWRWRPAAAAGPAAMLAAADKGEAHDFASWLAFETDSGVIHSLDTGEPPASLAAATTISLGGRLMLPGLHDSHIHCYHLGATSVQVNLADCHTIAAMRQKLVAHAQAHPDLKWIVGIGWDQTPWGRYPDRRDLDDLDLGSRPCWLWRTCFHIGVGTCASIDHRPQPI